MFIADESVDMSIVEYMKALFHQDYSPQEIISIQEAYSGIQDIEVLNLAYTKNRILLIEDKDFGELVYRMKYPHCGIVLIRIKDMPREERIRLAALTIKEHHTELKNNFQLLQIQE